MFEQMEEEVQRALAVLDLFASPLSCVFRSRDNEEQEMAGHGVLTLAKKCAAALHKDWVEACAEARQLREQGVQTRMVNGQWPAVFRLGRSSDQAAMLIDRFGNELEEDCQNNDAVAAKHEGREPEDRFGFFTLGQDCAKPLRRAYDLAWKEWHALDQQMEKRQAA